MASKDSISFTTTLPDDALWDGDRLVRRNGQGVAAAIFELFRIARIKCFYPAYNQSGWWEMYALVKGKVFHPWLKAQENTFTLGVSKPLFGGGAEYQTLMSELRRMVSEDERFTVVGDAAARS